MLAERRRRANPWTNHRPDWPKRNEPQCAFLALDCLEALYGGAAGGGKTDALLMAALQHVDEPSYSAILFRRTYQDLALPGALMDRAHDWLRNSPAHWNETDKRYTFPSGATLVFGYMDTEAHKYRYQGAEFQFIGFDELTQFPESQYRYLFHRLRRLEGSRIPIRMRAATNPGGIGHEWVKARFVTPHEDPDRRFVPSLLQDNPYLDQAEYLKSLEQLDPVTRAQLLNGNWDAMPVGNRFHRDWFGDLLEVPPANMEAWVRYWDKAATEDAGDWSAGVLMGRLGRQFYVLDVVRGQWSPASRNAVIRQTTRLDAEVCPRYTVWTEQEPGSGGKESALNTISELAGYDVHSDRVTGSKLIRALPFAAQVEAGNVRLLRGAWVPDYLNELVAFTGEDKIDVHDDQVDASSGAFAHLAATVHKVGSVRYA